MRKYCLNCVLKHLGQAFVLQQEIESGYQEHELLLIGHLSEASEEVYGVAPELAEEIRQYRVSYMEDPKTEIPYFELYNKVKQLIKEKGCGGCKKSSDEFKKKLSEKIKQKTEENKETNIDLKK